MNRLFVSLTACSHNLRPIVGVLSKFWLQRKHDNRTVYHQNNRCNNSMFIGSLRTNFWRRCEEIKDAICNLNGTFHLLLVLTWMLQRNWLLGNRSWHNRHVPSQPLAELRYNL